MGNSDQILEKKNYCEGGQILDDIAHRTCGMFLLEGSHNSVGHSRKNPDPFRAALNRQLDYMTASGLSQPKLFYDCVTKLAVRTDADKSCR